MEEAIQELELYQQGMVEQLNRIGVSFDLKNQDQETKNTATAIYIRIKSLTKTINHLKNLHENHE